MIYITLDRLLGITLNIRYPVYWNENKAKYLLIGTWVLGFISSLAHSLAHRYMK